MPRERDAKRERFWRRTIKAWMRSGGSIRGFCAERGLTETAFHSWRRELRQRDEERERGQGGSGRSTGATWKAAASRRGASVLGPFVPVRVTAGHSAPVEIERNGTTIRLQGEIDVDTIAGVLRALEDAAC